MGGFNGNVLNSAEKYDTLKGEWEDMPNMVCERYLGSAILLMT